MTTELLNAEEVAGLLGLSKSFVYTLIRRGQLPAAKCGSAVCVHPDDLERFIRSNQTMDDAYRTADYLAARNK